MRPALALRFADPAARALLEDHARRARPRESCGVLLGRLEAGTAVVERVVPAANVHPCPRRAFEVDPGAVVGAARAARGEGRTLLGFFHSHPDGTSRASAADHAGAWPGTVILVAAVEGSGRVTLSARVAGRRPALRVLGPRPERPSGSPGGSCPPLGGSEGFSRSPRAWKSVKSPSTTSS